MAKSHDRAARLIANRYGGKYDPTRSPDVRSPQRNIEVKSTTSEIPTGLGQLRWSRKPTYIALPAAEHPGALQKLEGTGVGLMNHNGDIVKKARRG